MNKRKIIFLDLDGVLNTARWHEQARVDELKDDYGYTFDPIAVSNLADIIEKTGADIVLSSSWKVMGLSKIQKMWKDRRLPGKVVGLTPNSVSDEFLLHADLDNMDFMAIRGQEIKEWLMTKSDVTQYVILDDMNDILQEQESHFIWIDPEVGITTENVVQTVMTLNCVN